jgi:hypothetical protein
LKKHIFINAWAINLLMTGIVCRQIVVPRDFFVLSHSFYGVMQIPQGDKKVENRTLKVKNK